MDRYSENTPLKIKYVQVDLLVAPKGTSSALGTLKKGAVVTVMDETDPYYYKVQLDNGLEGYVYKDSGVKTFGVALTRITSLSDSSESLKTTLEAPVPSKTTERVSSTLTPRRIARSYTPAARTRQSSQTRIGNVPSTRVTGSGPALKFTSAEIAVLDKPGIVGKQVAKVRRGEQAVLLADDGSFYKIRLATGITGYIPKYAGEIA